MTENSLGLDYDQTLPLEVAETDLATRDGVRIAECTFTNVDGARVTGYVVAPQTGTSGAPGVVLAHSMGRQAFLPDAVLLGQAGAVALSVDLAFSLDHLVEGIRASILTIRRGADLLVDELCIDPARLGFVGHSYGAMMGATVSGIDHRFRCFVFEVGLSGMSYHLRDTQLKEVRAIRHAMPEEQLQKLLAAMAPYDAVHFVGRAGPAALLFQSARFDPGVTEAESRAFFDEASDPKQIRWYDTGHEANDLSIITDRARFLAAQLDLVDVEGVLLRKIGARA